jgi:hypothetical protein
MNKAMMLFLAMIFLVACENVPSSPAHIAKAIVVMPIKYGDNVYYFDCEQANFGKSLQFFISSHPNLKTVTATSDNTGAYGATNGYFVIVEVDPPR